MMEASINIIHAYNVKPIVHCFPEVYVPHGYLYIVKDHKSVAQIAKSVEQAELEKNEWIRKYDNVLHGLQYWKERALDK